MVSSPVSVIAGRLSGCALWAQLPLPPAQGLCLPCRVPVGLACKLIISWPSRNALPPAPCRCVYALATWTTMTALRRLPLVSFRLSVCAATTGDAAPRLAENLLNRAVQGLPVGAASHPANGTLREPVRQEQSMRSRDSKLPLAWAPLLPNRPRGSASRQAPLVLIIMVTSNVARCRQQAAGVCRTWDDTAQSARRLMCLGEPTERTVVVRGA